MEIKREQLALAAYALRQTGFRYGMYVFLTGCDEMACTLAALLKHDGAAGITMGAFNSEEEEKIKKMGFSSFVYGRDNLDTAKKLTDGRLFDLVFETTGNSVAYDNFIDMIKRGGGAGILARLDEPYTFFVKTAIRSQIRFIGLQTPDERSKEIADDLLQSDWRGLE